MAKVVRYNGGTESYYGCTEPNELVKGKEYEVIAVNDRGWQTDYTLKGVSGRFNSAWFDDVNSSGLIFMAIAHCVPTVGERLECSKLQFVKDKPVLVGCSTSPVKEVEDLGNNIYKATTCNSVYVVMVG